ncbi:NAD-dependent epimerase/dehydratase family protein [Candidatus Solirubrobacter pratensis]|uniref:NAD-dependent epimerase/dehydratase family protein n=1 Tax=Candidatus Solirubrobacter pratensis TaxID=1298857 RepID=UPI0003FA3F2D|nr:NAD-dependent epimerase/dehydratase family protein [Candidatus Solirubrobacter pratensis]
MTRHVLVTGGAGFIGSNLVDALLDEGREVTVLDDLSTGSRHNLVGALNRGARLINGSIGDRDAIAKAMRPVPDTVFHLAAQIDVRRAVADPEHDAKVNLLGTIAVLEGARAAGVRRIVLASTGGAIYGDAETIPTPETAEPRPLSPYAASKAAAESYCMLYSRLYGLECFTLRLANVYGPRQDPRGEAGVIALFCANETGVATVFGDGRQTRDFVYVGDVVDAFVRAGNDIRNGMCNISTGRETSVLALAAAVGLEPDFRPERPGEIRRSCLDPSLARRLLGWTARTSLQEGLALTSTAAATRPARPA